MCGSTRASSSPFPWADLKLQITSAVSEFSFCYGDEVTAEQPWFMPAKLQDR